MPRTDLSTLLRGLAADARTLLRQELALVRIDVRDAVVDVVAAAAAATLASGAGLIGGLLFSFAAGELLAWFFDVSAWIGIAIVAAFLLAMACGLLFFLRERRKDLQALARR